MSTKPQPPSALPRPVKPTVNDIARTAGVSLATVDRVLNRRPGVREGTIEKVNKAIRTLGYVRDAAAANLARGRVYRHLFLLPDTDNEFVDCLEAEIDAQEGAALQSRTILTHERLPAFDPAALARRLNRLTLEEADGVAVFGPASGQVRAAIRRARDRGLAVVTLVSDQPDADRAHFVGVDNIAAGRTAGLLLGRFIGPWAGRVLVLTGSRLSRDHEDRRQGFDEVMRDRFPTLATPPSIEMQDDPHRMHEALRDAFDAHHDILGVYSSAAGNEGLIRFLQGRRTRPVVVAHELTPISRSALTQGLVDAVISQDAGHLIRSAIRLMRACADETAIDAAQERIRLDVYLQTNMPPG